MLYSVVISTRKMQQTGCSEENNQFIEFNSWKKSRNEHVCRDWPSKMTHVGTTGMSLPNYCGSFLYFCICTVRRDTVALWQQDSGLPFEVVHMFVFILVELSLYM